MKESAVMIGAFMLLYDWLWRWPELPGVTWRERLPAVGPRVRSQGLDHAHPGGLSAALARHRLLYASPVSGQLFVDNPSRLPACSRVS